MEYGASYTIAGMAPRRIQTSSQGSVPIVVEGPDSVIFDPNVGDFAREGMHMRTRCQGRTHANYSFKENKSLHNIFPLTVPY
jgi:hypothetical protein